MNLAEKVLCRTVQAVFRAAMPLLPYRKPALLDSVEAVPNLLLGLGVDRVLLVTDRGLCAAGLTGPLENALHDAGIACTVFADTRANPTVQNAEDAFALYQANKCQALVALGGGSSMDCAKAVGARAAFPHKTLDRMKGLLRVWKPLPTLIAIPTTAGTGSETTITAVITDSVKKHKYTMNNFSMIPRYAVLDPEMTVSLPASLTATTGMDALTHAAEAYIGRSTTVETRALALEATTLIFNHLEDAVKDGTDRAARAGMLEAAFKAGIAFSKSYVGYVHAVAHSLGGQYNIPHGLANAVLLPYVLESYGHAVDRPLHDLAVAAGVARPDDADDAAARRFIDAVRTLNRRLNIPETLQGIREEDIPSMARHAAQEANPLYPVPVLMDAKQLELFYRQAAAPTKQEAAG